MGIQWRVNTGPVVGRKARSERIMGIPGGGTGWDREKARLRMLPFEWLRSDHMSQVSREHRGLVQCWGGRVGAKAAARAPLLCQRGMVFLPGEDW